MQVLHINGEPLEREFTRSRDVLASIRPSGWVVSGHNNISYSTSAKLSKRSDNPWQFMYTKFLDMIGLNGCEAIITTPHLPTETLAELHAIIQAIEYERKNQKGE